MMQLLPDYCSVFFFVFCFFDVFFFFFFFFYEYIISGKIIRRSKRIACSTASFWNEKTKRYSNWIHYNYLILIIILYYLIAILIYMYGTEVPLFLSIFGSSSYMFTKVVNCVSALCIATCMPQFLRSRFVYWYNTVKLLCQLFEGISDFVEFGLHFLDYIYLYGPGRVRGIEKVPTEGNHVN